MAVMTHPDERSSPAQAPVARSAEAKGSGRGDLTGAPSVPLSEVIDLIENQERARASAKFRAAAVLGMAVPVLMLAFGYFFISSVAKARCLYFYGGLGACDPLGQIAEVTVTGQMLVLGVVVGTLLRACRRPLCQRKVAGFYLTIASSAGWALITGLFAAMWLSGNP
jgi:hypothetical protein